MNKLDNYIVNNVFPIEHTGIGHRSSIFTNYGRRSKGITYSCSFCGKDIPPENSMSIHWEKGILVENGEWEVLGFECEECLEAIREYDNLYYG